MGVKQEFMTKFLSQFKTDTDRLKLGRTRTPAKLLLAEKDRLLSYGIKISESPA